MAREALRKNRATFGEQRRAALDAVLRELGCDEPACLPDGAERIFALVEKVTSGFNGPRLVALTELLRAARRRPLPKAGEE